MKIINVEIEDAVWELLKRQATTEFRPIKGQAAVYVRDETMRRAGANVDAPQLVWQNGVAVPLSAEG